MKKILLLILVLTISLGVNSHNKVFAEDQIPVPFSVKSDLSQK